MDASKSYHFFPALMLRTPAYPQEKYQQENIGLLIKDHYFLAAVKTASEVVYNELKKIEFNEARVSPRLRQTLLRYLNRMCHRSTPFGLFSSVSMVRWGEHSDIQLNPKVDVFICKGFHQVCQEAQTKLEHSGLTTQLLQKNSSVYYKDKNIRYYRIQSDENGKRSFTIESARRTPYLDWVLENCPESVSFDSLTNAFASVFNASTQDCGNFIDQLVNLQILIPALQPNITGAAFDERVLKQLHPALTVHEQIPVSVQPDTVPAGWADNVSPGNYVNMRRKAESAILATDYQKIILAGLSAIDKLTNNDPSRGLADFRIRFLKKFDRQTIPLLIALDPELGVGYGNTGSTFIKSYLDVQEQANPPTKEVSWSQTSRLLFKKWASLTDGVIEITDADLASISPVIAEKALPATTSVVFRINGSQVFLEQTWGATATSMIGRFTPFCSDAENVASEFLAKEAESNPDVIFAELVHLSDFRIANIERRKRMYAYEIPILTGSENEFSFQISLDDLYVHIEGDEVILSSKRLTKRIVPRLSSAYNFSRSDLSVFRFLCELQYDSLHILTGLSLEHFFPGLDYYPRLVHNDCIFQLATWYLSADKYIKGFSIEEKTSVIKEMKQLVEELSMPEYISLDIHDNQLVFNTHNEADLELFSGFFKTGVSLTVREYPFAAKGSPVIGHTGESYMNQFVAAVYHEERIYSPLRQHSTVASGIRTFPPGSEWIYFKVYCHPSRANEILLSTVAQLTAELQLTKKLTEWFFIRYTDPDFHLRLRFRVEEKFIPEITHTLSLMFAGLLASGLLTNFQTSVYERELERYPSQIIQTVESAFCADTVWWVKKMQIERTNEIDPQHFKIAVHGIRLLLDVFRFSLEQRRVLFDQLYHSFKNEFSIKDYVLDKKYRQIKQGGMLEGVNANIPHEDQDETIFPYKEAYCRVASKIEEWPDTRKSVLLADLVHMHLNRFFISDARRQELVLYFCLYKAFDSLIARSRKKKTENVS
jgi:thiopeptide-type bacteriocin biosynthesis protein